MMSLSTESLPVQDGVEHRFVDVGGGVTIHVADAGPADGPPVMLVHGFPAKLVGVARVDRATRGRWLPRALPGPARCRLEFGSP